MVVYNFKKICPIPKANEFLDVVLTRTQRKTPTVVHPGYQISRIRSFYMRKVKFTQQTFNEKLSMILDSFPRMDEIHPFYADLINVLYDRDHYKLALGQLNTCRHLIDTLAKDYIRMLKYGDSLYRCKQLKRAALGRMCTLLKKQNASLGYLEEVRKHLGRLPSIDPSTRSLILTGFPNVGKSSFMNKVTRANVDVQPYAFTTKSLFVGHMDYKYLRWQVIDTPGILDHPLEERNTIEMQAVTALAHLKCCVIYFLDLSCQCGFSIEQQVSLFNNIKPLFANKPLFVAANKIDVMTLEQMDEDDRNLINEMIRESGAKMLFLSTLAETGVMELRNAACDKLLQVRVDSKLASRKVSDVRNRLHVAMPKSRDNRIRPASIPPSVVRAREAKANGSAMETDKRANFEDPHAWGTTFNYKGKDLRQDYLLKDDSWKTDMIPEIMDGKNVADFYDADIVAKLDALEREEEGLLEQAAMEPVSESDEDEDILALANEIRDKRKILVKKHRAEKGRNTSVVPKKFRLRSASSVKTALVKAGGDATKVEESVRVSRKRMRSLSRNPRSKSTARRDGASGLFEEEGSNKKARTRSHSRVKTPQEEGIKNVKMKLSAVKLMKKFQKQMQRNARKGGGDRHVPDLKPKHLFSGKRTNGTHDWR